MFCNKCGKSLDNNAKFCTGCGERINIQNVNNYNGVRCPNCGSGNISFTPVTTTSTNSRGKTKGFGPIKACLGFFLFNLPGILCGLCGMGKGKTKTTTSTTTQVVRVCQNCGHRF